MAPDGGAISQNRNHYRHESTTSPPRGLVSAWGQHAVHRAPPMYPTTPAITLMTTRWLPAGGMATQNCQQRVDEHCEPASPLDESDEMYRPAVNGPVSDQELRWGVTPHRGLRPASVLPALVRGSGSSGVVGSGSAERAGGGEGDCTGCAQLAQRERDIVAVVLPALRNAGAVTSTSAPGS